MKTTTMPAHLATYTWYAEHQAWLASFVGFSYHEFPKGTNPVMADLNMADLGGADLSGADLSGASGIVSFGPVGATGRIGYAVRHKKAANVQLGCFWGTKATAIKRIQKKYGKDSAYEQLFVAACRAVQEQGQ